MCNTKGKRLNVLVFEKRIPFGIEMTVCCPTHKKRAQLRCTGTLASVAVSGDEIILWALPHMDSALLWLVTGDSFIATAER